MMLSRLSRLTPAIVILSTTLALSGCGYNDFQRLDEQTKSAWAEVLNQYQRRADLIPNLVETVKGETSFEQDTLTRVIEARSRATAIQVSPETLNDPQAMERFQQAQGQLHGELEDGRQVTGRQICAIFTHLLELRTQERSHAIRRQGCHNSCMVSRIARQYLPHQPTRQAQIVGI